MNEELTNYCFSIAEQMVEALSKANPEFRFEFNKMLENTYTEWEQDSEGIWTRYNLIGESTSVSDGEDPESTDLKNGADEELIAKGCILLDKENL
jgi:hypothetical protein